MNNFHKKPFLQNLFCSLKLRPIISRLPNFIIPSKLKASMNGFPTYLNIREGIQRTIFFDGYEKEQTVWFEKCLKNGDVVIDVGANFGYYTTLASVLVGNSGRVIAFEPSPLAYDSMRDMILNSESQNIELINGGLGSKKEFVDLYLPHADNLYSPSMFQSDPSFSKIKVPIDTLDDFATENNVTKIDLIKIDVEGNELEVIRGMTRLLKERRVRNIICEFNSGWLKRSGASPSKLLNTILEAGFVIKNQTVLMDELIEISGTFTLQDVWFILPEY